MKYIFFGMALILLDAELTLGNGVVGLLPDFAGYYFLMKGLNESREKLLRGNGRKLLLIALPVSLGAYILAWFQGSYQLRFLSWGVGLLCTGLQLTVSFLLVNGICRMDEEQKLGSGTLKNLWAFLLMLQLLSAVLKLIPLVGWVCALAELLMGICFLAALYRSLKKMQEKRDKI